MTYLLGIPRKKKEKHYKFLGMPNGYSEAMFIFTKIGKSPFSLLRKQGLLSLMVHICKTQQKSSVINMLMQQ